MYEAAIKELLEKRANVWEQTKAILEASVAEGRDLTAEEAAAYASANADVDALAARAAVLTEADQRAADIAKSMEALNRAPLAPEAAQAPVADSGIRAFFAGEKRSFEQKFSGQEARTLSKLTAGAGGATVKTSFANQLVAHLIEVSSVLNAGATILTTSSGEALQVPKTTAHSTAALVTEGAAIGVSDPAFALQTLNAYKFAFLLQLSNELLTDTSIDLEGYIAMQAGRALGNSLGGYLVTGTGTAQPQGLATAATTGVTGGTGVVGAFTADNLIDLYFSVIAPYRNSSKCGWLLRDSSLASVRKLKDSTGQYLWQPSVQVGQPDTLLGKPVNTDPNVAAVAVNAKSVLFGDFSAYTARLVDTVRLEASNDYAFNQDLVTYRAILRGDGALLDTSAVKAFVGAAS